MENQNEGCGETTRRLRAIKVKGQDAAAKLASIKQDLPDPAEVRRVIARARMEEAKAFMPLVYDEMRRISGEKFKKRRKFTLGVTALAHEAFFRVIRGKNFDEIEDRGAFFAVLGKAMENLLIEHHRGRVRRSRDNDRAQGFLQETDRRLVENGIHVERVRYVVDALSEDNPRQGDVCRLKFWFGFKVREIADMLKVSEGTVEGDWRFAKAYLKRELGDRNN